MTATEGINLTHLSLPEKDPKEISPVLTQPLLLFAAQSGPQSLAPNLECLLLSISEARPQVKTSYNEHCNWTNVEYLTNQKWC